MTKWKETVIGKIPEDWDLKNAEDFCTRVTDGTHDSPKKREKGKHLITSKHLKNGHLDFDNSYLISAEDFIKVNRRSKVDQWDVILSMIGTLGNVYLERSSKIDYAIKNVGLFKTGSETKGKWLYFYFQSKDAKNYISASRGGTTQEYITLEALRKFPIPFPQTTREVELIIGILDSLDQKIELNNQMNKTLENIAQAIFKRWFIDFEFPNENGEPYKSSGGEMVESELGMIPKGWEVQKLGDLISLDKGLSYKGKFLAQEGDGNVLINLGCIKPGGGFLSNGIKYYNGKFNKNHIVRSGDVVVANTDITQKREILGSPIIIPNRFSKNIILFTHHLYAMRLSNKEELTFVFFLMQTQRYRDQVTSYATGTTVLAIPKEAILDFKFVFPDINVLRKFNDLSQLIFNEINLISETNPLIEKIRDLLLPKLMTGKIRVPLEEQNVQ